MQRHAHRAALQLCQAASREPGADAAGSVSQDLPVSNDQHHLSVSAATSLALALCMSPAVSLSPCASAAVTLSLCIADAVHISLCVAANSLSA